MERSKDYYALLGVPRDASRAAIKRAYRRLTRKQGPAEAAVLEGDTLAELQTAYETLTDAERRRRYDAALVGGEARLEPLAWSAVRGPGASDLRRPVTPEGMAREIVLGPAEATEGGLLSLDVPVTASCPACEGTGGPTFDCERCQGEGKVARRLPVPVQVPPGVRDGEVFQVRTDDPGVPLILFTVHIRRP